MKHTQVINKKEVLAYQYFDEADTEETIMLIHGNMSSGVHFAPLIERLKDEYRLIVPDLRGFGDSTYAKPIRKLGDFAEDLMDLLDQLNIECTHVVGWSTGGGVAMKMAAKFPAHVGRVVLLESCSHRGYPIYQKNADGTPSDRLYSQKEHMAQDPQQVKPIKDALEKNDAAFMKSVWKQAIYNVKEPSESDVDAYINETLKQRNLIDVDWALMQFNMSKTPNGVAPGDGSIDEVNAKVLSIYGEKDLVITRAMYEETLRALTKGEGHVYPEGSHSPVTDRPGELSSQIESFLKR